MAFDFWLFNPLPPLKLKKSLLTATFSNHILFLFLCCWLRCFFAQWGCDLCDTQHAVTVWLFVLKIKGISHCEGLQIMLACLWSGQKPQQYEEKIIVRDSLSVFGACNLCVKLWGSEGSKGSKARVNSAADRFVRLCFSPILCILVSLGPNPVIAIIINERLCSRSEGFTQT